MKLAGSSGAGQELKSRFAMPVLRFCSGAVLLLAGEVVLRSSFCPSTQKAPRIPAGGLKSLMLFYQTG